MSPHLVKISSTLVISELLAFFLGVSLVHLFLDNFYNTLSVIQHLQTEGKEIAFFSLVLKGQYHGRYHDFGQKFAKFKL